LNRYFGDCKLSEVMPGTSVIVTSVKRTDNRVKIFKSKEAILDVSKNFYMRDVARATSAAPIYFPAAEIKNVQATR
jgi:patatin-like phospholipase/acyl hydrolase